MQLCNAMHVSLGTLIYSILLVGNSAWLDGLHPQSGTGAIASSKGSGWLAWCLSTGIFKSRNSWIRLPNRRSERVSSLKISSPSLPASHLYVQESNKRERERVSSSHDFPRLAFAFQRCEYWTFYGLSYSWAPDAFTKILARFASFRILRDLFNLQPLGSVRLQLSCFAGAGLHKMEINAFHSTCSLKVGKTGRAAFQLTPCRFLCLQTANGCSLNSTKCP